MSEKLINKFYLKDIITGIISGAVGGFFGAGGGVFTVLFLKHYIKFDSRTAHASAVAAMLPITIISCIIYITKGTADIALSTKTAIGGIFGGILAGYLLKKIKGNIINKIFGILMIITGIWMLL